MNLNEVTDRLPTYDELCTLRGVVKVGDLKVELAGAIRRGHTVTIYALHNNCAEDIPAVAQEGQTNRQSICRVASATSSPSLVHAVTVWWEGGSARVEGGSNRLQEDALEQFLLVADFLRAGWQPIGDMAKWPVSNLFLTDLTLDGSYEAIPFGSDANLAFELRDILHFRTLEEPFYLRLQVGDVDPNPFFYQDSRGERQCFYINQFTLTDLYAEAEARLADPRLLEQLSPEELQKAKEQNLQMISEICPKGLLLPVIVYESETQLNFYDLAFLAAPHVNLSHSLLFLLKSEQRTGPNGLRRWTCALQESPVPPETREMTVELLQYLEEIPGQRICMARDPDAAG